MSVNILPMFPFGVLLCQALIFFLTHFETVSVYGVRNYYNCIFGIHLSNIPNITH